MILNRELGKSCNQKDFVVIELGKSLIWVLGFLYIYIYVCMYKRIKKKIFYLLFFNLSSLLQVLI